MASRRSTDKENTPHQVLIDRHEAGSNCVPNQARDIVDSEMPHQRGAMESTVLT